MSEPDRVIPPPEPPLTDLAPQQLSQIHPFHLLQLARDNQLTPQQIENFPPFEDQAELSGYLSQSLTLEPDQLKTGLEHHWSTLSPEDRELTLDQSVKMTFLALREATLNPEQTDQFRAVSDIFANFYQQNSAPPAPAPTVTPTEIPTPTTTETLPEPQPAETTIQIPDNATGEQVLKMADSILRETPAQSVGFAIKPDTLASYLIQTIELPMGVSFKQIPQVNMYDLPSRGKIIVIKGSISAALGAGGADFNVALANKTGGDGVEVMSHNIELSGQANRFQDQINSQIGRINEILLSRTNQIMTPGWSATRLEISPEGEVVLVCQRQVLSA